MSPIQEIVRRYYYDDDECYYQNGYRYCNRTSAWSNWVRWLVLAVIVIAFFLLFVLCSCLTARRRRKAGRQPFYGTGWASRPGQGGQTAQPYYNNQHSQPAPPYSAPPYSAQPTQTPYGGANQGYYGQQQGGVELQQPQPTYGRGGDDVYAPPAGPPPGKGGNDVYAPPAGPPPGKGGDGIVR